MLSNSKRKLATTNKEYLSVVWAYTLLQHCLEGTRVTIWNDHQTLKWILTMSDTARNLVRWCIRLSKFELRVVHSARIKPQATTALPRLQTKSADETVLDDRVLVLALSAKGFSTRESAELEKIYGKTKL